MISMVNMFALGWLVGVGSSIAAFMLWSACVISGAKGGGDES